MNPFRVHRGLAAPLDRPNVDTDQIIPKQFLKRIGRSGFGEFLFYDWAHGADGVPNAEFLLNQPRYRGASILIAGKNFGCGSSREHAAWALADFGFRAVLAPAFADIFATNAVKNGLLPVTLTENEVATLIDRAQRIPGYSVCVDLERNQVSDDQGFSAGFVFDEFRRYCLLNGLDEISLTLRHEAEIANYEAWRRSAHAGGSP